MYKIESHPILTIPDGDRVEFMYNGTPVVGQRGMTIAAALHQAGFPVHSHSLAGRNRSLACGIGKCGACEMLVDGVPRRICITRCDDVRDVRELTGDHRPEAATAAPDAPARVFRATVAIVGAGPAGLAARETLNRHGVDNILIDNNSRVGGQFTMQTHQFFFYEREKRFGGARGFDIPSMLLGDNSDGILLDTTVWDILDGKRLAAKNLVTGEIFYVDADHLLVATGAIPFVPVFGNDDLPGVYTAAVMQKMMNTEQTLLGRNILTVGAGNIGYLTSYQAVQAGAKVRAIIEAMPTEGGFPVQANRVRRLGIPIYTSHMLLRAIPNADHTGVVGAVVAQCKDFKPIPGTERVIEGIDAINICTGLIPDNRLFTKAKSVFGRDVRGAGDATRIGEGTSAVSRGRQAAFEILDELGARYDYNHYIAASKELADSLRRPERVLDAPAEPQGERRAKPFVVADCLYGFACNPCSFSCPQKAITKASSSGVPVVDYGKCVGCMQCVTLCPGLAIFGYDIDKDLLYFPVEYPVAEGVDVVLVDNQGAKVGEGVLERVTAKPNKTNLARVRRTAGLEGGLTAARGFIVASEYAAPAGFSALGDDTAASETHEYVCHCEDVTLADVLRVVGDRRMISVDEIKHTTRLGMGACRGKRCVGRLRQALAPLGIELVGDATPRAPMTNPIALGDLYPKPGRDRVLLAGGRKPRRVEVPMLIAGGGMAGSALFRYAAEAGMRPTLLNFGRGSSWRNIAGGRPAFSVPELADIARNNMVLFQDLQKRADIHYRPIRYVSFAHDQATYQALERSMAWSDARMVDAKDFAAEVSPYFDNSATGYISALITEGCWQATPGLVVDLLRFIGKERGGQVMEECRLLSVDRDGDRVLALARGLRGEYIEIETPHFVNALGYEAEKFAAQLGYKTGLYPVRHQAFITRRLPFLGAGGRPLDMLIDRRDYKGFNAVYGQQLAETGQIIGCASPSNEMSQAWQPLPVNEREFLEIAAEIFGQWIPRLTSVGIQSAWSGYYVEPRMIVDPARGLLVGLRGHGFMLSQYLAKMYVDALNRRAVPDYFGRLSLDGDGLSETAFK